MYAWVLATQINNITKPVKILSMGTGIAPLEKVDPSSFTKLDWIKRAGDLAIDNDVFAADKWLEQTFKDMKSSEGFTDVNYKRMQTVSTLSMDKVDKASIDLLLNAGDQMWSENKDEVQQMIREICDDRFS